MVFYLADITYAFLAPALVCGILFGLIAETVTRRMVAVAVWTVAAGLIAGGIAHIIATSHETVVPFKTTILALTLISAVLCLASLPLLVRSRTGGAALALGGVLAFSAILGAEAMFDFLYRSADRSLTATAVLNTELILNLSAILIGSVVVATMVFLVAHVARRVGWPAAAILAVTLIVMIVVWCGEVMLGLLQLGTVEVTSGRISFVAKVTGYSELAVYAYLGLLASLAGLFFLKKPEVKSSASASEGKPVLRKKKAFVLSEMRWLKGTVAAASFLFVVLLYHDLYASLPPSLSEAAPVTPDDQGLVRIPVETVKDGNLHRFAYVASDGHRVRFFLINRYDEDHVKIGVVFDACMICGDDGYIQKGNELICIACNVRVFIPSVGKPGGCNPIPLAHEVDAENIVIAMAALEKGARYFSEVVEVEVTDPVTGEKLINLDAPFQYDFRGKTFFFGSQESYDLFKSDPEKYAGETLSRYYRVQGHQTARN